MARKATIERKTKETDIKISLNLDGTGIYNIRTAVPFMDHMFSHIARHGFFDLTVKAKGDTEIDDHHTVEDLGIAFGQALKKALGDSKGIRRYAGAGRAERGHPTEASELDTRCGHSGVLRQHEPRVDHEVCGASGG